MGSRGGRLVWLGGLAPYSLLAQEAPTGCAWRLLGNCLCPSVLGSLYRLLKLRGKTKLSPVVAFSLPCPRSNSCRAPRLPRTVEAPVSDFSLISGKFTAS